MSKYEFNERFGKKTKRKLDCFNREEAREYRTERRLASEEIKKHETEVHQNQNAYLDTVVKLQLEKETESSRPAMPDVVNITGLETLHEHHLLKEKM